MAKSMFRKVQARYQGLKMLVWGEDGVGKSVFCLSFPGLAYLDAEAKLGVYENNPTYNRNIMGIIDSLKYSDLLGAYKEVIKTKPCETFITDSITYICNQMKVALMELEEERALKNGGNPDDQSVSLRGYGKQALNIARLRGLKAQASTNGLTIIDTAHKKDITKEINKKTVKVGEAPDVPKNSRHEYDVIIKLYKEKDLGTGKILYKGLIEKDTTQTFEVGSIIDNPCYDNTFKEYIEKAKGLKTITASYGNAIEENKLDAEKNEETHSEVVAEFEKVFKALDIDKKTKAKEILKAHDCVKYKDISNFDNLKTSLDLIKQL